MANNSLYTVHIDTSSGARFSYHDSEEEMRTSLIEYWNEVHAEGDEPEDKYGPLLDDADLETVKERIEQVENVSIDETHQPSDQVWICIIDGEDCTSASVTVHRSYRTAIEAANIGQGFYYSSDKGLDLTGMSDQQAIDALEKMHDRYRDGKYHFTIYNAEIQD